MMNDVEASRDARLIVKPQELPALPHHAESDLPAAYGPRLLHLSAQQVEGADLFITSRTITELAEPAEPNVQPHRHSVSQTYLLLGPEETGLEVEVEIEGQRSVTRAPASIFVPAGALHVIRVLRGTGTLMSVVRSGVYE